MRKSWLFALAVVVVGGLAGIAIAGRPERADPFVLDSNITVPIDVNSTSEADATTTTAGATATTAASAATTTAIVAATPTSIAVTTTTTTELPATTEAETTTTTAGTLPRDQVRLVIANGDGRFKLATTTADRLRPLGYIIDFGDALQPVSATIIYYRPGFDDEAVIAANDIGVPGAVLAALPTSSALAVTNSDGNGDVIVVLGPDAPR